MFARYAVSTCSALRSHGELPVLQSFRAYSSHSRSADDEANFQAAREWYKGFNKNTIPVKIAKTTFSMASGPGGQKTNKTSSKATTTWPLHALLPHIPKVLHQDLKDCQYYVRSSDSIQIHCDAGRDQSGNREETYQRLTETIGQLYKKRVPGVTSLEQKKRVENLRQVSRYVDISGSRREYLLKQAIKSEKASLRAKENQEEGQRVRAKRKAAKEAKKAKAWKK